MSASSVESPAISGKAGHPVGGGVLEHFLSIQRSKLANRLICSEHRQGRVLDVGCGVQPFFLLHTEFAAKVGIDKFVEAHNGHEFKDPTLTLVNYDLERETLLPFEENAFSVVTMLAVFEHIEPLKLVQTLREIRRVLHPGGMYVMTTPAVWTDVILRCMARVRLVSPLSIQEHKDAYSHAALSVLLRDAGFAEDRIRLGYFECFMNVWATATK